MGGGITCRNRSFAVGDLLNVSCTSQLASFLLLSRASISSSHLLEFYECCPAMQCLWSSLLHSIKPDPQTISLVATSPRYMLLLLPWMNTTTFVPPLLCTSTGRSFLHHVRGDNVITDAYNPSNHPISFLFECLCYVGF
jgi:hypothetical protein